MGFAEIFILAVGLSMDAFAVAVCKGLAMPSVKLKELVTVGAWFGSFQAIMPLIGYFLGTAFEDYIKSYDHWIAFVLLAVIGGNMIKEAFSSHDEGADASVAPSKMLILALATSIDALAAGIPFSSLIESNTHLSFAVLSIGVITFVLSCVGVKIGNVFGTKYKKPSEITGGVILVLLGTKILLEHLEVISF